MPPEALTVTVELLPLQATAVKEELAETADAGWVTVIMASLVQPPVATTCTVFDPAVRPVNVVDPPSVEIVCVVAPRVTEYGGVPPLTVAVTEPFEPPKQLMGLCVNDTVKPTLKVTATGVTKSSRTEVAVVEVFVRTKTSWT